jgi:hypothetical protein
MSSRRWRLARWAAVLQSVIARRLIGKFKLSARSLKVARSV